MILYKGSSLETFKQLHSHWTEKKGTYKMCERASNNVFKYVEKYLKSFVSKRHNLIIMGALTGYYRC